MFGLSKLFICALLLGSIVLSGMVLFAVIFFEVWIHHLVVVGERSGYNMDFVKKKKNKLIEKNK